MQGTIRAIWRIESPKLVAGLTRMVRDVGLAEELAQDALVTALERWPETGVPDNPGAWLMATAKHRAIDLLRRGQRQERTHAEVGQELEDAQAHGGPDLDAALDEPVADDLLRLLFIACHPVLSPEARVALTLRLLGGLTTEEIARAYLVPEPTIAQRIVRAKRTLSEAGVPYEVPRGPELTARVKSVLEVLYLIFNEGHSATSGNAWIRPELCDEALRLGRVLAGLLPDEAEVHGLVALMELQASRLKARVGPDGAPVLLLDQDRGRWDHLLIRRGLEALARAESLSDGPGRYTLQAGLAACHARARAAERHRLAPDRRAVRGAGSARALAGGGAQPRGGGRHGRRSGGGAGTGGRADRRPRAPPLPPAAQRPGRPPLQAGTAERGRRRVRAGRLPDEERARTHAPPRARGALPAGSVNRPAPVFPPVPRGARYDRGMATDALSIIHTLISLIGIATGFVVLGGMFRSEKVKGWTEIFLLFTILTSVTGYFFPFRGLTPAQIVGAISLVILLLAVHALYGEQLRGAWRGTYVICAVFAQYLNCFVLVVQLFQRVPFLHALAPKGEEPPFAIAQGLVLLIFVWLGIRAFRNFHPEKARTA